MMENEKQLIYREDLLAEYDRVHIGPPGGARKLIADAPTVDAVEVVRIEETKQKILQIIDEFIAEYRHISQSSIDHFGGKADAMETARRLVNAALTDYCPNCGAKMDGGNDNV